MLTSQLPDIGDALQSCLDLVLRWIVARICDGNTQCLLKVLELYTAILDMLIECVRSPLLNLSLNG